MPNSGLASMAAAFEPDVLVLSHADDDHIGGFSRFVKDVDVPPRQIWVPYEWGLVWFSMATVVGAWPPARPGPSEPPAPASDVTSIGPESLSRLPGVGFGQDDELEITSPVSARRRDHPLLMPGVIKVPAPDQHLLGAPVELLDQTGSLNGSSELFGRLELSEDISAEIANQVFVDLLKNPSPGTLRIIRERLEDVVRAEQDKAERPRRPSPTGSPYGVARDIVDRAAAVCEVLAWASKVNADVRFFSTDAVCDDATPPPWTHVGEPGVVTLVNAHEVRFERVRVADAARSLYLAVSLTTTNRRALVTFLWPDMLNGTEGALIWSDSAGETCLPGPVTSRDLVPWAHVGVMTAPHHGSPNPDHDEVWRAWDRARTRLKREIPVVVSGGKPKARVAEQFLELSRELRACTNCRHSEHRQHRTVSVVFVSGRAFVQPKCE